MDIHKWIAVDSGCTKLLMSAEVDGRWVDKKVPTGMDVEKEYVIEEVKKFIASLPYEPEGMGIGAAGLVSDDEMVFSDTHGMEGLKASDFGLPCHMLNDVKAATVWEGRNVKDDETLVMIMAGSGFAEGVIEHGSIVLGRNGWAGELGSLVYPLDGEIQKLDSISGGVGILERAGCPIEEFLERIKRGEAEALRLIKQGGTYFGMALSDVIHTFNPSRIVIGGSTSTYPGYMEAAMDVVKKHTIKTMLDGVVFAKPDDPARIVALGARKYAFEKEAKKGL